MLYTSTQVNHLILRDVFKYQRKPLSLNKRIVSSGLPHVCTALFLPFISFSFAGCSVPPGIPEYQHNNHNHFCGLAKQLPDIPSSSNMVLYNGHRSSGMLVPKIVCSESIALSWESLSVLVCIVLSGTSTAVFWNKTSVDLAHYH